MTAGAEKEVAIKLTTIMSRPAPALWLMFVICSALSLAIGGKDLPLRWTAFLGEHHSSLANEGFASADGIRPSSPIPHAFQTRWPGKARVGSSEPPAPITNGPGETGLVDEPAATSEFADARGSTRRVITPYQPRAPPGTTVA